MEKVRETRMNLSQTSCSFCGKPRRKVRDLIGHKKMVNAFICNECVEICRQIVAQSRREAPGNLDAGCTSVSRDKQWFTKPLRCSFCARPQDNVRYLISSPSQTVEKRYICDRCVGHAGKILLHAKDAEQRQGWGLAGWLKRKFGSRPGRLHRLR
jgi:ATP-dependent protease Clp ATPase subunit